MLCIGTWFPSMQQMWSTLLTTLPSGQHWWVVELKGFPPQQESALLFGDCFCGDFPKIEDVATVIFVYG